MAKTTNPHEHTSHDQKSHECCGGAHAKDKKSDGSQKPLPETPAGHVHEQTQKSGGCCGGGKANK